MAAGVRADGSGVVRVVRTPGIADAFARIAPDLVVEEIDVAGPPTSTSIRGAGTVEAQVLVAGLRARLAHEDGAPFPRTATVVTDEGASATVTFTDDGGVRVELSCGAVLDEVVLRSYAIGAVHMGLGWVTSEGLAVGDDGTVHDLTIRSFGVLRAADTPTIEVVVHEDGGPPVNGSDAVFAATAAAAWSALGWPTDWPTRCPVPTVAVSQ